jgi:putative heme-binding domain-containing protein
MLFAGDWLNGRILAFRLRPAGASFTAQSEVFARGEPLPVTDLAVGPDGALYFTTGGRAVRSGLYRIVHAGVDAGVRPDAGSSEERAKRELRRSLEDLCAEPGERTVAAAWPHLDDPDRHVRAAARVAIERRPFEEWRGAAREERRPLARIEALLAAARVAPAQDLGAVLESADAIALEELAPEGRLALTRVIALVLLRGEQLEPALVARITQRLERWYPSGTRELDRELATILTQLGAEGFLAKALERLASAEDATESFHLGFVLRAWPGPWTLEQRRRYVEWLNRATQAGAGRSRELCLQGIRRDFLRTATRDEWRELKPLLAARLQRPSFPAVTRRFVRAWIPEDFQEDWDSVREHGDPAAGRSVFGESCSSCHRLGAEGTAQGPELEGLAGRFTPRDLLESVLEPSRFVPDRFALTEVWTKDERVFVGEIARTPAAIVVRPGFTLQAAVEVPLEEVQEVRRHPLSPMPEGLLDVYERQEILDLLAFLGGSSER